MKKNILLLILLFLIHFSVSLASSNETDQQALLAFQNLVTSPTHFLANNWTKNTSFCFWFGVTCSSKRQRVVALTLPNLQLQGTISPSLANLSFLSVLNLENNSFHGGIPYGLGHLPRLQVIDIQNNQLNGSVPTSLFQHRRVQNISLAFNELSGEMWKGPWYVPELRVLDLGNNSLTGMIPPSIGNATKLMNFDLSGNRISGNIPKEIGNLSQLAELFLYDNQLTGSIPAALFNISSLLAVSLRKNSLSGPLLLDEGNIVSNLEFLRISFNQISGHIPSNICQLTQLKVLFISYNNITGDIPRNIDCLSKLEGFYIGVNTINGTIPTSLGNISTLRNLDCSINRIVGQVPSELGKLSNLRLLNFGQNSNLIGEIPEAIFNISSLEIISFDLNNLSGRIPTTTGLHLPNLKQLHLANNQLEGEIPLLITNASKLEILSLAQNFLTGTIPTNLGNLRELRSLFLHHNQLTNEPREHELRFFNSLADCRMLRYLHVAFNPLNGVLPNSIGNLSSTIQYFEIGRAHINGIIPTSIGNMSGLTTLAFYGNNLTGSIPPEIGKLKQLQGLDLDKNKLQGYIPEAVCNLSNLVELYLNGNELSGLIPECLGNLSRLQKLYLGSNKFSSTFPLNLWKMSSLLFLSVSRNSIEGEVPSNIGELKAIVKLYLYSNHFSGMLPSQLGDLQNLNVLDLSNNSFLGSIPLSFANLISLEYLDLSLNALSGTIPKSLEKLSYLKSINVSFNGLEGEIPGGGVFANSTLQSFLGNKGLCGMHILEIPACAITNPGKQSKLKEVVLKIVTPVVISSFLIFLLVSIWIMKRRKKGKSKDVEKVSDIKTHQLVSYHEIQRATNNFDGSNLIGEGSSGSVYKGTLSGGTLVAIKVLDLENEQVCKRFDTECEVMRNVRHRNLVPVITTCSSDYVRAFVLKYMSKGSLENWLYREESHLNLHQRVTAMLDVALAVEYLHHGNDTPIVHCDLKPANVLLDEDMVAHVGDFGISKILALSKSMAYTETLGTLGYIAPEYGSEGIVSASGDVYSYGIMLMEVLTKRRPTDEEICNENLDLRKWIAQSFSGTMMDVVDANLFSEEEQINSKSEMCISSMIELALDCTKETPESRIIMKDVVKRLNKINNTFLEFSFANNSNLIGQIPEAIFNISSLEIIDFSFNNLSGRIPTTTGLYLPNLKELDLAANQLEGEIPLFITNASKLEKLELAQNFLTGTIPNNLGNLRELQSLFLHHNQLTNEPREHELRFFHSLADCRMLRYLQVGSNPLSGILPNSIGNLSSTIQNLEIGYSYINGLIPTSISNMSSLIVLSLAENNLAGSIPPEFGKLKQLQGLYLANNKLQGHITEEVCHLSNLVELYLNGNELSGLIPECLGKLTMLQRLYLGSNKFSSKFPLSLWKMSGLLYLSVSQNSIEGEVPSDIGGAIIELNLSSNHFSGMIPSRLGDLQNLKSLDLSKNSFSGLIPLSFANLISLEYLDLSLNALSGTIPKSLEKLSYLKSVNVSLNGLEGEIPSGGVFASSTLRSFLGNKGLCGMHILEVPACAITNPVKQSKLKEVLLKIVTPVVISSFLIFLSVTIWIMKRPKKGKSKDVEKVPEIKTHQLITYHEIQRATNNFDESNLIGVGGSGSVYKGTLSGGTAVAIKVLDLKNEQVCKRFDTECKVMRNVRHRNLVPVITTCCSDYIRAFVLKYMSNGSLENCLYREESHLNLLQRITVMLDAAMAIEYLHHGNDTPIVHCDLKPANVLLDEDMVAHVGDFGISTILAVSKSMTHTETLGTLGYIAPEYGSEGIVSACGDVYSYGIMLMEVLTKRRPTDEEICNENLDLRKWITQSFSGNMMDVVDANLFSEEEQITSKSEICIASMIELALDCTKETPESRITMKDVVKRLNKIKNSFLET